MITDEDMDFLAETETLIASMEESESKRLSDIDAFWKGLGRIELKARTDMCEEASPMSRDYYIPCNAPATTMIAWPSRNEGPYRMCESCAWHNVKNRGATDLGPYKQ